MSDTCTAVAEPTEAEEPSKAWRARYDFRPSVPDVSTFPRAAWLRSLKHALATMPDADLGYGDQTASRCSAPRWPTTSAG